MKKMHLQTTAMVIALTAINLAITWAGKLEKEIVGLTPEQVRWFTPSYYNDGRQRSQLFGDSGKGGTWVDRVRIPSGKRVLAHTHPKDELLTVIEGTWYVGTGEKFDAAKLIGYPRGQFYRDSGRGSTFRGDKGKQRHSSGKWYRSISH